MRASREKPLNLSLQIAERRFQSSSSGLDDDIPSLPGPGGAGASRLPQPAFQPITNHTTAQRVWNRESDSGLSLPFGPVTDPRKERA